MDEIANCRRHGKGPFTVAVIHGGPGAAGEMAPVARELSRHGGILEPLQNAMSIDGQVEELNAVLKEHGSLPITLIGHSWGAWLSLVYTVRYPSAVKKLILVGSGPFTETHALKIMDTRMTRLSDQERSEARALMDGLQNHANTGSNPLLARFGELFAKSDSFDRLPPSGEMEVACRVDIFKSVWDEARALRQSGELVEIAKQVHCPVVAIHGDYDPHPAEGVEEPLQAAIADFRFILLKNCGHEPWSERQASDEFYRILRAEL